MSSLASRTLATLPAITLGEIECEAALQTRVDRKYVVTPLALEAAVEACGGSLRVLDIAGERRFAYRSTYFDTPDLWAFRAAATGRRPRFKVRTRRYLATGTSWLEVKLRDRHDHTVKHRVQFECEAEFDREAIAFLSSFAEVRPHVANLSPSLITTYERTTLLTPSSSSMLTAGQRVTIDRDVECWPPGEEGGAVFGHHVIVETKSPDHRPGSFDRALWYARVRPVRISKYAVGIATAHPDLPANRWNRALRRYVQPRSATSTRP